MDLFLGAALAIGLTGLGAGFAEGMVGKKSIELMGKNSELSNSLLVLTILGMALVESIAIYGLIIALKILGIDPSMAAEYGPKAVAAGLAIGLSGLAAAMGEGFIVMSTLESVFRNPEGKGKFMVSMILFVALVEAIAIYGLIIALKLLG